MFQLMVAAVSTAQFKSLKFGDKDYWLKVEVKIGSSDFVEINSMELLAVPYARAADNGGTILPFAGAKSRIPFGYLACDGAQQHVRLSVDIQMQLVMPCPSFPMIPITISSKYIR